MSYLNVSKNDFLLSVSDTFYNVKYYADTVRIGTDGIRHHPNA